MTTQGSTTFATVSLLLTGVFAGGVTMVIGTLVHEGSVLVVSENAMWLLRRRAETTGGASLPTGTPGELDFAPPEAALTGGPAAG